jgi:hypothetical protein
MTREAIMTAVTTGKTPWHLWAVGALGLLWNAYGAFDYFMSQTKGEAYFSELGMTDAQIAHYAAMPAWMTAVWAIGVWGAVLGSVLLLLRMRLAVPVFLASLMAYVASVVYAYAIAPAPDKSTMMIVMQGVIFVACVFFYWYARGAALKGLLR